MHTSTVHFLLNEALTHLQEIVSELDDGRMHSDDTPELAVALGHVLDHICKAWNVRELSLDQMAALSPEEHDRMCSTVPDFHGQRVLGELACG